MAPPCRLIQKKRVLSREPAVGRVIESEKPTACPRPGLAYKIKTLTAPLAPPSFLEVESLAPPGFLLPPPGSSWLPASGIPGSPWLPVATSQLPQGVRVSGPRHPDT